MTDTSGLTQLGQSTPQPASPEAAMLERVPSPPPDKPSKVRLTDKPSVA